MKRGCACCLNQTLLNLWELPKLPLTGIYFDSLQVPSFEYYHDQNLLYCENCTHLQLSKIVDPDLLYLETYTHRTSQSQISKSGNEFLLEFIQGKKFQGKEQILEIGCNDVYLLENLENVAKNRVGIDPIFSSEVKQLAPGFKVKGGFAETVDYSDLFDKPIDLIISAHTFEHIVDPIKSLVNLKNYVSRKLDFIIEVPSSIRMFDQLRLDQIFSQHINYYSPYSMSKLMSHLNLDLVDIAYNFSYWGGTQILHFSNYQKKNELCAEKISADQIREAIMNFSNDIQSLRFKIRNAPNRILAYGAAQMLPILQYHLGDDFDSVSEIFDDNPERIGKYYPYLDKKIRSLDSFKFEPDDMVIVTALDSCKPLVKRLLEKQIKLLTIPIGNI
jgi:hypothetical protein